MANNMPQEAEEQSSPHPGFSLPSIARTVWKRRVCIISVWVLASIAAVVVVRRLPAVYVAQSRILVDSQKIPEKFVSATVATDLGDRIAAIREQIITTGELKKIITDFDLYKKERKTRFEEEILDLMRKDIDIQFVPVDASLGSAKNGRPDAFTIGYEGPDPALVAKVANRLTDLYVEQNLKTREEQAAGTSEFLDAQVQEAKKRLDDLEAAVSSYKLKHNGELPQQEASLTAALADLRTRLEANRDAINRAQQNKIYEQSTLSAVEASEAAQVRALDQAGGAAAAWTMGAPAPRKRSEILQEQLDQARTTYTDKNPIVITLRAGVASAKRDEEQQQARTPSPGPDTAKSSVPAPVPPELARTREQIAGLNAQISVADADLASRTADQKQILRDIDQHQSRIDQLPVREQEMARITRDYETAKEYYKSLLDKQSAANMSLDMEKRQQSERFTILDRATVPERPVKPKKPMLYAAGSAAGLALGLLVGFIIELRQNVFLGEWELPQGTTVLARLPYIEIPIRSSETPPPTRGKRIGRTKQLATASSVLLCLHGVLGGRLPSVFDRL